MFTIPLNEASKHGNHSLDLCYEFYGIADKYFNLLSDRCLSVNSHFSQLKTHSVSERPLHVIDQITIMATNMVEQCVHVTIGIDNQNCLVTANGAVLRQENGEFNNAGVHVLSLLNRALISVPNCGEENIVMAVKYKRISKEYFLEFHIQNGKGIQPSAHGIIGLFKLTTKQYNLIDL